MLRHRSWLIVLLLIAIVLAVYFPILRHDFVGWDDPETISENPLLNPPSWRGVAYYWSHGDPGLYAPLTYLFWSALALIAWRETPPPGAPQLNPAVFHFASLVLHVVATVTVFAILRQLLRCRGATMGALLFALHPLQVESVAWATAGKDLLCGVFSLLAIYCYIRHRAVSPAPGRALSPSPGTPGEGRGEGLLRMTRDVRSRARPAPCALPEYRDRGNGRLYYAASVGLLVLALLSKTAAVVVPAMLVVLDVLILRPGWRTTLKSTLPLFAVVIPFVFVARHFQTQDALPAEPLAWRPIVAADAVGFYVQQLLVPTSLAIDYGRTPAAVVRSRSYVTTAFAAFVLALALGLLVWRRMWTETAAILIFVLALLPVLGLVPFMFQIHSTVADHYVYLAMLGPALLLASLAASIPRWWMWAGSAAVIAIFAVAAHRQTRVWHDSLTLFTHARDVNPGSATVHANLGNALGQANDLPGATREFETAVRLERRNHMARRGLAQAYLMQGRYEDAIEQARLAIDALLPGEDPAREHFLIGLSYMGLRRYDGAIAEFQEALRYRPDDREAMRQLAVARRMKETGR